MNYNMNHMRKINKIQWTSSHNHTENIFPTKIKSKQQGTINTRAIRISGKFK